MDKFLIKGKLEGPTDVFKTAEITKRRLIGISLVVTGATLWGVSGTVAQYLFQHREFTPEWLVVVRLLIAGVLLLMFARLKEKKNILAIWKSKNDRVSLILFSILGMLGVQYTYFAAIAAGNAATATLLQYLGPVFIAAYLVVRSRRFPTSGELLAITLALLGTFLLVTNGNPQSLSISKWALFWGIASGLALAFYTLQPAQLIKRWSTTTVVGWGMLLGGVGFSTIHPPWKISGDWSMTTFLAVLFIVIFGTLIAFYCYLESLNYISATETSLLACTEPLSAAFLSVIWLHVSFGLFEWLGTVLILTTIVILSLRK